MAVCGVSSGNFKSEWKCLFSCSHKDLVELHSQKTDVLVFHRLYCNKNIVDFLFFQRDIAFYLRTKCCAKFYIEKNADMYYKLSDVVIKYICPV